MLIHWIWLAMRPALSDRQKKTVLDAFSDAEDVYCATQIQYQQVGGITHDGVCSLMDKSLADAEKILRQCMDKQIKLCVFSDEDYPQRLKHIVDPPLVLYYKGNLPATESLPVIAVVGTRGASAYGLQVARRLGYQIAACGGAVVSGVAKGNDAMAMEGALLAGGTVIGVLGCGVDVVYPAVNRNLYADIIRNGCLISEFPPKTPPYKWNFPKRNRILSGMSNGTVVIEAPEGSGALITARQALEQGRDVFAVPGNVDMPSFVGNNALLREGAITARNGWDVIGEYERLYPETIHKMDAQLPDEALQNREQMSLKVAQKAVLPRKKPKCDRKKEKKPIDKEENPPYSDVKGILPTLPYTQQQIVQLLTEERLVDEIIEQTGLPAAKVSAALTVLEIKGIIRRLPGKRIRIK